MHKTRIYNFHYTCNVKGTWQDLNYFGNTYFIYNIVFQRKPFGVVKDNVFEVAINTLSIQKGIV